jgi:Protein of unknown function (DUF3006)
MDHLVIESIESDLAICTLLDGRQLDLPRSWLPETIREADHLDVSSDGQGLVQFSINAEATQTALKNQILAGRLPINTTNQNRLD